MELQSRIATFSLIALPSSAKPIQIVCNHLTAQVDHSPKKSPKYRKVGKTTKALLFSMVDSGSSIVSAATKLGINYSTAKSIIQTRNKERVLVKGSIHSSTDISNSKQHILSECGSC